MSTIIRAKISTSNPYYIFEAVTKGKSYASLNPPCGKEYFYKKYRQFFWLLDKELS